MELSSFGQDAKDALSYSGAGLFLPLLLGEMIQFDLRIFFKWVETTN